ncbi:uncharacterized protein BXZ73DRAFT_80545 [Epithele typhae]|uniref:uncharacterized protein n=1 Tax=Epithele typhae TaxID=378194 RepID=UPI002007A47B|nr:uncharacterized protein BXZ73DRAFT_80545 [Epithele typhae]KAH9918534.1 hypothetical protein BXZ73DRAFT_80545 [Epithele typhae]
MPNDHGVIRIMPPLETSSVWWLSDEFSPPPQNDGPSSDVGIEMQDSETKPGKRKAPPDEHVPPEDGFPPEEVIGDFKLKLPQDQRCSNCKGKSRSCIIATLHSAKCLGCIGDRKGCSLNENATRRAQLESYKGFRLACQVTDPDRFPRDPEQDGSWARKDRKDEDVPSWYRLLVSKERIKGWSKSEVDKLPVFTLSPPIHLPTAPTAPVSPPILSPVPPIPSPVPPDSPAPPRVSPPRASPPGPSADSNLPSESNIGQESMDEVSIDQVSDEEAHSDHSGQSPGPGQRARGHRRGRGHGRGRGRGKGVKSAQGGTQVRHGKNKGKSVDRGSATGPDEVESNAATVKSSTEPSRKKRRVADAGSTAQAKTHLRSQGGEELVEDSPDLVDEDKSDMEWMQRRAPRPPADSYENMSKAVVKPNNPWEAGRQARQGSTESNINDEDQTNRQGDATRQNSHSVDDHEGAIDGSAGGVDESTVPTGQDSSAPEEDRDAYGLRLGITYGLRVSMDMIRLMIKCGKDAPDDREDRRITMSRSEMRALLTELKDCSDILTTIIEGAPNPIFNITAAHRHLKNAGQAIDRPLNRANNSIVNAAPQPLPSQEDVSSTVRGMLDSVLSQWEEGEFLESVKTSMKNMIENVVQEGFNLITLNAAEDLVAGALRSMQEQISQMKEEAAAHREELLVETNRHLQEELARDRADLTRFIQDAHSIASDVLVTSGLLPEVNVGETEEARQRLHEVDPGLAQVGLPWRQAYRDVSQHIGDGQAKTATLAFFFNNLRLRIEALESNLTSSGSPMGSTEAAGPSASGSGGDRRPGNVGTTANQPLVRLPVASKTAGPALSEFTFEMGIHGRRPSVFLHVSDRV